MGRIGKIHLDNICNKIGGASVAAAMSPSAQSRAYAEKFRVPLVTADAAEIFDNPDIDGVMICSATDSHADYVVQAAMAGKSIFCEKPLDLSVEKVQETLEAVRRAGVPLMLAFNQRFDPHFASAKARVASGEIGKVHTVHLISRDPAPPPVHYLRSSGGLFMDMMIHDFDMARFITGKKVVEVFAKGYNLTDPEIGAVGDIDTAVVLLTFEDQSTAIIQNSRKTTYGYDQRLEVFGSEGLVRVENPLKDTTTFFDHAGAHKATHFDFFMDRYAASYLAEAEAFLRCLRERKPMPVTGEDGLNAMIIAEAAGRSMRENKPIRI